MKVAKVRVSIEILEMMLLGKFFDERPGCTLKTNAPDDLKVLGLGRVDEFYGVPKTVYVFVGSDSFADVLEGAEIPDIGSFRYEWVKKNNGEIV